MYNMMVFIMQSREREKNINKHGAQHNGSGRVRLERQWNSTILESIDEAFVNWYILDFISNKFWILGINLKHFQMI